MRDLPAITPWHETVDGTRIRYVDGGVRGGETFLLTSPHLESLRAFQRIWPALTAHGYVLAIDLPGLGRSQQRVDLLTPTAMGDFLLRVLDAFELRRPHLVAPDIGTSAGLFAAAARPDAFATITIGSGAAAVPLHVGGILKDIIDADTLDTVRALDHEAVIGDVLNTISPPLPDEVRKDYLRSYEGDRFAESCRYIRSCPSELPMLADQHAEITTPVQILHGAHDPLVPALNGYYLRTRLPDSVLHVLDAGHFPWEERPEEYGRLVRTWAHRHPAGA